MRLAKVFYLVQKLRVLFWWFTRPLTLGVKGLVMDESGRVLLVRHTYQPGWHLPGGKVEKGESIKEALLRELHEEVGVDFAGTQASFFSIYVSYAEYKSDHVALFVIKVKNKPELFVRRWEIAQAEFFAEADLPDDTTAGTVRRIREVLWQSETSDRW